MPAFKSLRRIFALSSLFFLLLDKCEVLSLSHFLRKQLEIIFDEYSHLVHIHVFSHLSCRSLWIPLYHLMDSFNHLLWSSSAWSSTPRMVFKCTKLLKFFHHMVYCVFGHLQELINLLCSFHTMKLNYCLSFDRLNNKTNSYTISTLTYKRKSDFSNI